MYKRWSKTEIEYITTNWGKIRTADIAKHLDRTTSSVHRKAHYLGLKMDDEEHSTATGKIRWTKEMDKYLEENYSKISIYEISEYLSINNIDTIRKRASYKGYTEEYHKWTPEEEEYLQERWGEVSVGYIARKLGLTYGAVRLKSYQMGLTNQLNWSGDLLSIPTVHEITGVSKETLYNYVRTGLIKSRKLSVGKTYRYQIHYTDLIKFLKEHQDKYNTKNCDVDFIKSLLSTYRLTTTEKIKVMDLPDWWLQKLENDKDKPKKEKTKKWTKDEDRKLILLLGTDNTHQQIANKLGRTLHSTRGRIRLLKRDGIIAK